MKLELTTYDAVNMLLDDKYANWTRPGASALVAYLEECEALTGQSFELDAVAIRCDYAEYKTALEAAQEYGFTPDPESDDAEADAFEWLRYCAVTIDFDGGVIVGSF